MQLQKPIIQLTCIIITSFDSFDKTHCCYESLVPWLQKLHLVYTIIVPCSLPYLSGSVPKTRRVESLVTFVTRKSS